MQEKEWLSLVAIHSDAWLLTVAFYFGARFGFDKADKINQAITGLPSTCKPSCRATSSKVIMHSPTGR
ncbi:hypothetical protein JHK84_052650 [Glycine max]|nr:hypothetical protein JHK84_052650 [Glycine max]